MQQKEKVPAETCEILSLPMIGKKVGACSFEIYHNNQIKKMSMADYRGKWVILFFYPADFTFVCPTELEDMAEHYDVLKKMNAEVVSVSTDTAFVHKAWHDHSPAIKKITFPMAADPTGALSRMFGVYNPNDGLAFRGTFIINPDGNVVAYEVNDNSIGRTAAEILRRVQAAQFVATHKGQVCPAKWTPGKKTLKPGVNLIGKI